ncbi:MAG: hypothetical protein QOF74_6488 [Caballeronia mineralivorans]|nr:hypothetical protein [Caballeronia mineralivorans]
MASRFRKLLGTTSPTLKWSFHRIRQRFSQALAIPNATTILRSSHNKGASPGSASRGYNLRNYAELAMQRYKHIFGNTEKARALPQQKTEAWTSVSALNRTPNIGMPVSAKV